MKKMYVLQGEANSSTSTVLKDLEKMLKTLYPENTASNPTVILCLNGRKIGIEASNDNHEYLLHCLNRFKDENCDTIFCSCCTRGKSVEIINSFKESYDVEFIELKPATYETLNNILHGTFCAQAQELRIKANL